ncbi:MAG TPA: hypothetical protein VHW73_08095 [Rudaea sp.]|nr:hypothetical protein [Rudaea sp.]
MTSVDNFLLGEQKMLFDKTAARARTGRQILAASMMLAASGVAFGHAGDLDTGFGKNGNLVVPAISEVPLFTVPTIAVDSKHRIVLAVHTATGDVLTVMKKDGNVDTTFGGAGQVTLRNEVVGVAVDSEDRIVVAERDNTAPDTAVAFERYQSDGLIDLSFGWTGMASISSTGTSLSANRIALDDNDNVYAVGTATDGTSARILVAKVTSDGQPDVSIAGTGWVALTLDPSGDETTLGQALRVDKTGELIVTGYTRLDSESIVDNLVKLHADGTFDTSFGAGAGFMKIDLNPTSAELHFTVTNDIAIDADGNYVLAGTTGDWTTTIDFAVMRYTPSGDFDSSFNHGAPDLFSAKNTEEGQVGNVTVDSRGNIVIVGETEKKSDEVVDEGVVFRLNPDGTPDVSFGGHDGAVLLHKTSWGTNGVLTTKDKIVTVGTYEDEVVVSQIVGYGN